MREIMLRVAILGRPNVGKSTLFNRLTGTKQALVNDTPGMTRDRKSGTGNIGPLEFEIIDTAGLERAENESMEDLMMAQTNIALTEADLVFMMIDARDGLTPEDQHFAKRIRRMNKPIILLANKGESSKHLSPNLDEVYRLGFGEPVTISAEQGLGFGDLYEALEEKIEKEGLELGDEEELPGEFLQIALAGRPNVGKSTLFNKILGENRSIESEIAGTTRDSVYVDWEFEGKHIKLVDTAGLRKRGKRNKEITEKISVEDSYKAMQYANVVIMMIDATQAFDKMDLSIADHILEEGRGMVIVINKWDLVKNKKETMDEIENKIQYHLSQASKMPVITLSAKDGRNVEKVIRTALEVFEVWNMRISTGKLNRWLDAATARHIPPLSQGKRIRLRYITQAKSRPPTFILFSSSKVSDLPGSYLRYLSNSLAEAFDFVGVPLRISVRKIDNPYDKKKK
jgi:GTP-binding protein